MPGLLRLERRLQAKLAATAGAEANPLPVPAKPALDNLDDEDLRQYYREALQMAACQSTVRGFLIFHVTDETDYNRWQSGVYYADGTPKSSRAFVRQRIASCSCGTSS